MPLTRNRLYCSKALEEEHHTSYLKLPHKSMPRWSRAVVDTSEIAQITEVKKIVGNRPLFRMILGPEVIFEFNPRR